jgi:large subunit ribosomal protein L10
MLKLDQEQAKNGDVSNVGSEAKLQVVQTGILAAALKVVEFWDPQFETDATAQASSTVAPGSSQSLLQEKVAEHRLTHGLSKDAWAAGWRKNKTAKHGLEPLLSGPIALFTLPSVSTAHLRAALSILAPSTTFPAPKRKVNPGYYEAPVQNALQKLMLLGARVEGKAFDTEGVKWVGSIEGGLDGLRAQLVAALQGVGANVTTTLESAGRSLYFTVEGRRIMLEEEAKGPNESQ